MLKAGEKPYLFILLILIISTNVYLSCRIVPQKEGFIKKILMAIPNMIVQIFIGAPIRAIPHKNFRKFMLDHTELNKGPGRAISSLGWAIIAAILCILVMVPFMFYITTRFSLSFFFLLVQSMVTGLITFFRRNSMLDAVNQAVAKVKDAVEEKYGSKNVIQGQLITNNTSHNSNTHTNLNVNAKPITTTANAMNHVQNKMKTQVYGNNRNGAVMNPLLERSS